MTALVRRDIWNLEDDTAWHPITRAYAQAVGVMQARPASDPTSWAYQAAVHAVSPGGTVDQFRHQCQHGSWFFLPWHRMYLHWFEQMVREIIQNDLPDVSQEVRDTWALPYWNYSRPSDDEHYQSLPAAFRTPTMDDGTDNPLFVAERNTTDGLDINGGDPLPPLVVSLAALDERIFSRQPMPGRTNGFGGPATGWHHNPGPAGRLEMTPHGDVHTNVGGPGGFMASFDTAPLDPVFWLHHSNIDRLWGAWLLQTDAVRKNPTDSGWLNFPFQFHDAKGVQVTPPWTTSVVLDTTVAALGYVYEDPDRVPAPAATPAARRVPAAVQSAGEPAPEAGAGAAGALPDHPPELVGATDVPMELRGSRTSVAVDVGEPAGPARRAPSSATPQHVFVQIDDVRGENPGLSYAVYVNLPDGTDPGDALESHYVGNASFFGIETTNDLDRDVHGGAGLSFSYDITALAEAQKESGDWDPAHLTVTFVPIRGSRARGGTVPDTPPVTIGRVGVYYH